MSDRLPRLLGIIAVVAMLAAACGDGDDTGTAADPAATGGDSSDDTGSADDTGDTDDTAEPAEQATADSGSNDADPAPVDWPHTFVADQIGGGQLDANDLAGQDVILWFWAPW